MHRTNILFVFSFRFDISWNAKTIGEETGFWGTLSVWKTSYSVQCWIDAMYDEELLVLIECTEPISVHEGHLIAYIVINIYIADSDHATTADEEEKEVDITAQCKWEEAEQEEWTPNQVTRQSVKRSAIQMSAIFA